jgi:hypothetical protein
MNSRIQILQPNNLGTWINPDHIERVEIETKTIYCGSHTMRIFENVINCEEIKAKLKGKEKIA